MKTALVVFLAIVAVNAENLCTPKSLFKKDCNLCKCSSDGRNAICTKMTCLEAENDVITPLTQRFCEPGKIFKLNDYNSCTCNRDGSAAICTLSMITSNKNEISSMSLNEKEQYCSPGATFKLDECNVCQCSKDGSKALCTLSVCPNYEKNPKQVCQPLSVFRSYCNTCSCNQDGTDYACTRMLCDKNIWNEDGTLKTVLDSSVENKEAGKRVCEPFSRFKSGCNTCMCSADGLKYACTYNLCPENKLEAANKQICTPHSFFKEYCNTCICSKNGMSKFCTMMDCDKNLYNKDGSLKVKMTNLPSFVTQDKICIPKSIYRPDSCNTCTCNPNGTNYFCTTMTCGDTLDSEKKWGPEYKQGDACEPGQLFYSQCNTCKCMDNGKNAICTRMGC